MKYQIRILDGKTVAVETNVDKLPENMILAIGTKIYLIDLLERIPNGTQTISECNLKKIDVEDYFEVTSSDIIWSPTDNDFLNILDVMS